MSTVNIYDVLDVFWDKEVAQFSNLFIQLFVEANGTINYSYFNKFNDTSFSFKDINNAVKALSGSKVVERRELNNTEELNSLALEELAKQYEFGKYLNPRQYIYTVWYQTDVVLPRNVALGWVANQRPDKATSSFAPANDRNYGHDNFESKSLRKSIKESGDVPE